MLTSDYSALAAQRLLTEEELSGLAVNWQAAIAARLELDSKSKKLKNEETVAATLLIRGLREYGVSTTTDTHVVSVNAAPEYVPHVMDWDAYWGFILSTKDFSLLERRPGKSACQERWDAGVVIPGVEKYPVYKLTVYKKA